MVNLSHPPLLLRPLVPVTQIVNDRHFLPPSTPRWNNIVPPFVNRRTRSLFSFSFVPRSRKISLSPRVLCTYIFGTDSFPPDESPTRCPHATTIARAYRPIQRHLHLDPPHLEEGNLRPDSILVRGDPESSRLDNPSQKSGESTIWFEFLLRHIESFSVREKLIEERRTSVKIRRTAHQRPNHANHAPRTNSERFSTTNPSLLSVSETSIGSISNPLHQNTQLSHKNGHGTVPTILFRCASGTCRSRRIR